MATFNIYKNPSGAMEAVKRGWSWPGFFFSWIWAFSKGLYFIGASILGGLIICSLFIKEIVFIYIGSSLVGLWLAAEGNELKEKDLIQKGYTKINTLLAETPEGAIASLSNVGTSETTDNDSYCSDCGAPSLPNAKFCSKCGVKFD